MSRPLALTVATACVAALVLWLWASPVELSGLADRDALQAGVMRAGIWGPVLVVGLMTVAVVASPIPSAPIALAAGAAYGHVWSTLLVVAGAELGAIVAFALARLLGRDALERAFGARLGAGLLGSQAALTATVFASRLMPFVSFDMISYAAGLSRLHAWRFALATLAGIIPASFLLAHVGDTAASGDLGQAAWAVFGLGLATGLPILWLAMRRRTEQGDPDSL